MGSIFVCIHVKDVPCNVMDKAGSMEFCDFFEHGQDLHRVGIEIGWEDVLHLIKTNLQASNQEQVKDSVSIMLFDIVGYIAI